MRNIRRILALAVGGWLLITTAALGQGDEQFIKKLVAGSPWKGKYQTQIRSGTMDLVFSLADGKLRGVLQNMTGSRRPGNGPVSDLKTKDGVVEFKDINGTQFTLRPDKEGNLAGSFLTGASGEGTVVFRPAK